MHIIRKRDHTASVINLKSEEMKTFTFPETNFIGVTAYQNQLVSIFSRANCFIKYHIFNPALFVAPKDVTDKLWETKTLFPCFTL